jgi:hypothetical protein
MRKIRRTNKRHILINVLLPITLTIVLLVVGVAASYSTYVLKISQ